MPRFLSVWALLLIFSRICCSQDAENLSIATAKFALDMLNANGNADENVFFSPASISMCVGMVYAGAKGQTKEEIANALYQNMNEQEVYDQMKQLSAVLNNRTKDYQLNIANRAYIEKTFKVLAPYSNTLKTYFGSEILEEDFRQNYETVRQDINNWVAQTTNSKIQDLLPGGSLDSLTRLVLVNAIYFKGDWALKFKQANTEKKNFYSPNHPNKQVDMMQHSYQQFFYNTNEDAQVLGLPYVNEQLGFYIILPNERNGLHTLESKLRMGDSLISLMKNALKRNVEEVQIPKFKLEHSLDLVSTLRKLSAGTMFTELADLSGIDGKKDLLVTKALHKAFIEVNEEGSEATAATGIVARPKMVPGPPVPRILFIADHPFLFAIVDRRTWTPLFFGRFVG